MKSNPLHSSLKYCTFGDTETVLFQNSTHSSGHLSLSLPQLEMYFGIPDCPDTVDTVSVYYLGLICLGLLFAVKNCLDSDSFTVTLAVVKYC